MRESQSVHLHCRRPNANPDFWVLAVAGWEAY